MRANTATGLIWESLSERPERAATNCARLRLIIQPAGGMWRRSPGFVEGDPASMVQPIARQNDGSSIHSHNGPSERYHYTVGRVFWGGGGENNIRFVERHRKGSVNG